MARIRSSLVTEISAAVSGEEFVIVELVAGATKPVYDHAGQLMSFRTGEDASRAAREMTVAGRKFQPRRVKDDTWREREHARYGTKEYKNLPWSEEVWWKAHKHVWGDHYPHVSQKNSVGLMAYTETDAKGSADIQTAIKPGKYLERFFSGVLDQYIIRDLSTIFSNVFEDNCLIFADNEEEFESLYTSGPSSCMSHPPDKFTSHIHPVRVYAAGDLALVYMKRDGRVVARALCWPEKKTYSRVYGDAGRIEPLLAKDGFKKGTPFGAKLQRVLTWERKKEKAGNQAFVAPHIDDCNHVMDCGDHLLIGGGSVKLPGRRINLTGASGVTEWVSAQCRKCKSSCTTSELKAVYINPNGNADTWCGACVKEHTFICAESKAIVAKGEKNEITMHNGDVWWINTFRDRGFVCAGDGLNYSTKVRTMVKGPGGRNMNVSTKYAKEHASKCDTCGQKVAGDCGAKCKENYARQKAEHDSYVAGVAQASSLAQAPPASQYYTSTQSIGTATQMDWRIVEPPANRRR